MARNLPYPILVIAILHLIGGIGGLMLDVCGGGFLVARGDSSPFFTGTDQPQEYQERLEAHMEDNPPSKHLDHIHVGFGLILDALLISAGLGLLYLKSWARILSLVYGILGLLSKASCLFFTLITYGVMLDFAAAEAKRNPAFAPPNPLDKTVMMVKAVVLLALTIYPIVVLVVMGHPYVKAAFLKGNLVPEPEAFKPWGGIHPTARAAPSETYYPDDPGIRPL